jgi:hypothetical protein
MGPAAKGLFGTLVAMRGTSQINKKFENVAICGKVTVRHRFRRKK